MQFSKKFQQSPQNNQQIVFFDDFQLSNAIMEKTSTLSLIKTLKLLNDN